MRTSRFAVLPLLGFLSVPAFGQSTKIEDVGAPFTDSKSGNYPLSTAFNWDLSANSEAGSYDLLQGTGGSRAINVSSIALNIVLDGGGGTYTSSVDFDNVDGFWSQPRNWTFITGYVNSITGTFSAGTISADSQGTSHTSFGSFSTTQNNAAGTITVNWTPVPEPSSAIVGGLIGLGFLRRRRG